MSQQFFRFLRSPQGQATAMYGTTGVALGSLCLSFVPNTFLLEKHREFVALYKNGQAVPVPENVLRRYNMAIEFLKTSEFDRAFMKPFTVYGFHLYHMGSCKFRFGAMTGIPINFTYTSPSDINKSDVMIRGKPLDWNSPGGKSLEQALVFSEDEQIFGIAREILQLQTHQVLLNSIYPCVTIVGMHALASTINSRQRLLVRPFPVRGFMYILIGLFGYGFYSFLTDTTQVSIDGSTDEKLASLGKNFVESGIRFYDKLLKMNIAIRDLTGDSTYSAGGNENFILRTKRLPLTFRKAYFEARLREINEQEAKNCQA